MSAPQKPWENANSSSREHSNMNNFGETRPVLNSTAPGSGVPPGVGATPLPPLPPRPPHLAVTPRRTTSRMANAPMSMFGGYSGYGGYPTYGGYPGGMYPHGAYGYGTYGQSSAYNNRFFQIAEERSRDAFQSVESIVRAFSSVSMMLESTYHAMYSSFRAILGVVDNFSRLRQMFAQFISVISILKIIQNFYRKLLYWLGVIKRHPDQDRIWEALTNTSETATAVQTKRYPAWPIVGFLGLVFGGSYLSTKLFLSDDIDQKTWDPRKGTLTKSIYPHKAASSSELSFRANEVLSLAPDELQRPNNGGWLLASNKDGEVGYVPVTLLSTKRIKVKPDSCLFNEPRNLKTDK